jgi:hypothetical protein
VLEIREPDDPRQAVGRTAIMSRRELLDRDHRVAAPGEVIGGSAPHAANSKDRNVM